MDTSTITNTDSNTPIHENGQSKRRRSDTSTRSDDDLMNTPNDEAGITSILTKIDTLVRDIEPRQRFCRFAAKCLPEDESWNQLRSDLLDAGKQTLERKFKIVVLGASGVGKSSVLNVLLHEGDLLASGATGDACTAVPIEIHYNNDPACADVKAEVQYVTEVEWRSVIEQAKAEIDNEEDDRSDRGHSAVQRVSLVYPSFSNFDISDTSVDDVIAANVSKELLGKCNTLQASSRADFYRDFKQQIGSLKRPGFATWPLIDHVRLYVRHSLLEEGLVLVDIPGMFETNRARVENAAKYLEKCSAVCIMTHAARSNSDTTQKTLFSRALQQIQFDQHLDSVLFVCTKSDEINLRETGNTLDVPEAKPLQSQLKAFQQNRKTLLDESEVLTAQVQEQEKIADYRGRDMTRWRNAKKVAAEDWDSFKAPKERATDGKLLKAEANDRIWDEDAVDEKIASLKQERTTALSRAKPLRARLVTRERRLQKIKASIEGIGIDIRRAVFKARNDLIKEKQAQQYLSAVKMFERNSARAVEGIVKPVDDEVTQFDNLEKAKDKVFCVSALAYCRLADLEMYDINEGAEALKDNGNSTDFLEDVEDTEIPALARRLKYVALTERCLNLRKIQLKLQIALGALQGRLAPNVQKKEIDLEAATQAAQDLADSTSQFLQDFDKLPATDAIVKDTYKREFTDLLSELKIKAIKRATVKIEPHSRHPGEGSSVIGLWPAEYKAAVHTTRNGFYVTKRQLEDGNPFVVNFNETVATAVRFSMYKVIRGALVSTRGGIKKALTAFRDDLDSTLDKLHTEFRLHAITGGVDLRRIILVDEQLQLRKRALQQVFLDNSNTVSKIHVAASRHLTKDIESKWKSAYARAYAKYGTGARLAMSAELTEALTTDNVVEDALDQLGSRIGAELDKTLAALSDTLTLMANSIVAEYNGYMEHRSRRIESTGDPKLDKIRNRMIALGYEDLDLQASAEEEVSVETASEAADLECVIGELAREADEADDAQVKAEAGDDEVTDEEVKNEEMIDEETADAADE